MGENGHTEAVRVGHDQVKNTNRLKNAHLFNTRAKSTGYQSLFYDILH